MDGCLLRDTADSGDQQKLAKGIFSPHVWGEAIIIVYGLVGKIKIPLTPLKEPGDWEGEKKNSRFSLCALG